MMSKMYRYNAFESDVINDVRIDPHFNVWYMTQKETFYSNTHMMCNDKKMYL